MSERVMGRAAAWTLFEAVREAAFHRIGTNTARLVHTSDVVDNRARSPERCYRRWCGCWWCDHGLSSAPMRIVHKVSGVAHDIIGFHIVIFRLLHFLEPSRKVRISLFLEAPEEHFLIVVAWSGPWSIAGRESGIEALCRRSAPET